MSSTAVSPNRRGFSPAQYLTCLNGIVWREALRHLTERSLRGRTGAELVRMRAWSCAARSCVWTSMPPSRGR